MPRLAVTLRPAGPGDMGAVYEIHKHYVLNTVTTFTMEVTSLEGQMENLKKVQDKKLPYIVAISDDSKVVGYGYLSGFRSGKGGYRHTVELSLFCHPDHLYQGIGSELLNKLVEVMSEPEEHQDWLTGLRDDDHKIRTIIACMSVNTDSKEEGLGLKKYYESFGFEFKGHLSQVGHKFDKWIDTMYLQKTLW